MAVFRVSQSLYNLKDVANTYLKHVMNGNTNLPVKALKAEYVKLTAEH
ncbi:MULTISPECIES: hypothetical protein [unclassified Clostridioides]|nr:hypothetical protein [Clostridioides sp. ZZV14-6150]MCC0720037.1 hypothetical protein [Clostridioides sp. ZZV14-6105]MCC0723718.1 hypothetical protein [Clostridioides sp. ZZV14-6104]MCC0743012.1 hypothetical protein [Clostridioides sp. ZZV14-6044]MCC0751847.1 hypothetical protein [Clostridioides sp. ZZV13-5731]